MPFTSGSKTATSTPSATPGNSYGNGAYTGVAASASYDTPYGYGYGTQGYSVQSREDLHSYGTVGGYGNTGGMGMDRPLPPRSGPGGYGHRPRSIDLVTPYTTGH
jgi:hypothetical protein